MVKSIRTVPGKIIVALYVATSISFLDLPAISGSPQPTKQGSKAPITRYSDGVTIKRGPNGAVEVSEPEEVFSLGEPGSEAGASSATPAGAGAEAMPAETKPDVPNRPLTQQARPYSAAPAAGHTGTTHYKDGVVVRKNPDGSIEVGDTGSNFGGSAPVRHASPSSGTTRYADGVYVRHNSDGSIEVGDTGGSSGYARRRTSQPRKAHRSSTANGAKAPAKR